MSWRKDWEELRRDPQTRAWVIAEEAKHSLAANLYRLRKAKGMSQAQLAQAIGTRQPNISEIETADANPTVETLGKLAAVFDSTVGKLFKPATSDAAGSGERKVS